MSQDKILIVEDDPTIAMDIALYLRSISYEVVAVVHNGKDALEVISSRDIDLIMLDIQLEGEMTGIRIAEIVHRDYQIPFIYLSSYTDKETTAAAAHTYPSSYLVKPYDETEIGIAIQMALVKSRSSEGRVIPSLSVINSSNLSPITKGEYEIMKCVYKGMNNKLIMATLNISLNTLKTHIRHIYEKLDVHSRVELNYYLRNIKGS